MADNILPRGDTIPRSEVERLLGRALADGGPNGQQVDYLVPKGWGAIELADVPTGLDGTHLLAFWMGPAQDGGAPLLQLMRGQFSREIAPQNWLRRFASAMGYQVHQVDLVSDHIADALVSFTIESATFSGRLVVRFYGPDILIVLAADIAARYAQTAELLALLVRGASLGETPPGGQIEPRQRLTVGPDAVAQLPASWRVSSIGGPDGQRGAVDCLCIDPDDVVIARIRLKWIAKAAETAGVQGEIEKLQFEFEAAGLTVGERIFAQSGQQSGIVPGHQLVGQVIDAAHDPDGVPYEFSRIAVAGVRYNIYLAALFADRNAAFTNWAIGRRALDLLLETLQ